jgi:hypothetical protein
MTDDRKFPILHAASLRGQMVNAHNIAKQFLEAGKQVEVIVRERKSKRSIEQNRRLWEIYRRMSETIWVNGQQFSPETWGEHCKREFIGIEEIAMPNGSIEKRGISTTSLNVAEFGEYMESIERWCANQGYDIGLVS